MASTGRPVDTALFLRELLRRDFCAFLRKAWPWISAGEEIAWNWHFEAIAHRLDHIARGDNLRLLVTLPPRNGKSKTISVIWVAWMLGRDPRRNFGGLRRDPERLLCPYKQFLGDRCRRVACSPRIFHGAPGQ